ncbi:MAG TPA: helicase-associated domain-containing protein, partial [Actinomycetota bacterium]
LRGGRLFDAWQVEAPPLPLVPAPGAEQPGDPSRVLGDLEAVLDEWAQSPPPCLQKGGLGVRELKKTAKNLGFGERYVSFLYALAVEAELVGVDDANRIALSPVAAEWAAEPPAQRWSALLGSWIGATLWTEESDGVVPIDKVVRMDWLAHLRACVASELAALPPGMGTDAASLAARISWRFPSRIRNTEVALEFVERAVEALTWLGIATGPNQIAVVEPGRSAAREADWAESDGPGARAFAAEVATCTVGADLHVIVPGPPVHELASALRRFGDLKASSPARIYKLSEASVRRALDGGMEAAEIIEVLTRHSTTDVPQNVLYLIEDVARRHGNLVVGRTSLYLRSEDPMLLRAAVADRRLASMRPHLIAPTVAVLEADDVDGLLALLRAAGYLPVAERDGSSLRPESSHGDERVRRLLRPSQVAIGLSPAEAAALAATLRVGPGSPRSSRSPGLSGSSVSAGSSIRGGRPPEPAAPRLVGGPGALPAAGLRDLWLLDGRTARTPKEIQQLLELAVDHWMVVEILYHSQEGKTTVREIEPLEVGRVGVDAWCRLRDDERHFLLARIQWARATGEHYVEVPQAGVVPDGSAEEGSP